MMRSMFSGVSGLRIHQTKMDVIANNISNVNTSGYKASRVTFSEIFSQTVQGAAGTNAATGRGGINPMQIGLGANVASIDMLMTTGAAQRTDNPYDLMVQGEGFFVVSDVSGTYFTRAGAFRLDEQGYLVNPNGLVLNGWKAVPDPNNPGKTTVTKTNTQPIQITGQDESMPAEATSYIKFDGNLNAVSDSVKYSKVSFYDTLGNKYDIDVRFTYNGAAGGTDDWAVEFGNLAYLNGDTSKAYTISFTGGAAGVDPNPGMAGGMPANLAIAISAFNPDNRDQPTYTAVTTSKLTFTDTGVLDPAALTGLKMTVTPAANVLRPGAAFRPIALSFRDMTQNSGKTNATATTVDGNVPGTLTGVSIGPDGIITGRYSNGKTKALWQISLAVFKNPAGLERMGNNLYTATTNSGVFDGVGEEVGASGNSLLAGVLEMSNVDLAQEFTEMITTQRGFQANSRIITTSDEMLQELVNLKR